MRTFLRLAPAAVILAAAGCATMANGTVQRIPVTSDPPGAQVLLDGRSAGFTPTQVTVSRRNRQPVVEIEMNGFRPAVHRLERRENWEPVLWDVALGVAVIAVTGRLMLKHDEASLGFGQTIGVFALGAVPGIVDYSNGAAFRFRRTRIDAVLSALRQSRAQVPMRPVQPNGHVPAMTASPHDCIAEIEPGDESEFAGYAAVDGDRAARLRAPRQLWWSC